MSGWSDWATLAKSAIGNAQKKIDRALDIDEGDYEVKKNDVGREAIGKQLQDDFFAAFGMGAGDECEAEDTSQMDGSEPVGDVIESENTVGSVSKSSRRSGGVGNQDLVPSLKQIANWLPTGLTSASSLTAKIVDKSESSPNCQQTAAPSAAPIPSSKWSSWLGATEPDFSSDESSNRPVKKTTERSFPSPKQDPIHDCESDFGSDYSHPVDSRLETPIGGYIPATPSTGRQSTPSSDDGSGWTSEELCVPGLDLVETVDNDVGNNLSCGDSVLDSELVPPGDLRSGPILNSFEMKSAQLNIPLVDQISTKWHSLLSVEVPPLTVLDKEISVQSEDESVDCLENLITPAGCASSVVASDNLKLTLVDDDWQHQDDSWESDIPLSSPNRKSSDSATVNDAPFLSNNLIGDDVEIKSVVTPVVVPLLELEIHQGYSKELADGKITTSTPSQLGSGLRLSALTTEDNSSDLDSPITTPRSSNLLEKCSSSAMSDWTTDSESHSVCTVIEGAHSGRHNHAGGADSCNSSMFLGSSSGSPSREVSSTDLLQIANNQHSQSAVCSNANQRISSLTSSSLCEFNEPDRLTLTSKTSSIDDSMLVGDVTDLVEELVQRISSAAFRNALHDLDSEQEACSYSFKLDHYASEDNCGADYIEVTKSQMADRRNDSSDYLSNNYWTNISHTEASEAGKGVICDSLGGSLLSSEQNKLSKETMLRQQESMISSVGSSSYVRLDLAVKSSEEGDGSMGGDSSPPASDSSPPLQPRKSSAGNSEGTESISRVTKGSGYTSPSVDEIEGSILSSDIEILSNPTPNGDNGSELSYRSGFTPQNVSSPVKHSCATASSIAFSRDHDHINSSGLSQVDAWRQKVAQLTERLSAREKSLVQLSSQNAKLAEENQQLAARCEGLKHDDKDETTQNAFHVVSQELSLLREKCKEYPKLIEKLKQVERASTLKDEQIEQLMHEGQKLAKQELKHTTIIKKLREKEKEFEKLIDSNKIKLKEMDDVKKNLKSKEEIIRNLENDIQTNQLENEKQDRQVLNLQGELEDLTEKCNSYKSSVEKCYKEIAEFHKKTAMQEIEIKRLNGQLESSKREEMKIVMEKEQSDKYEEKQRLTQQIEDLKLALAHGNEEHCRREESLQWDVAQLQKKLQDAESRNDDLSETASAATKPLLRQIDSLQASFTSQQTNWERVERSLYDRIAESERKCAMSIEKEQAATSAMLDLRSQTTRLEVQLTTLTSQNSKFQQESTRLKDEIARLTDAISRLEKENDQERLLQKSCVEELQREKDLMSTQFEFEKHQLRKDYEQRIKDLERMIAEKETAFSLIQDHAFMNQSAGHVQNDASNAGFPGFGSAGMASSIDRPETPISNGQDSNDELWLSGFETLTGSGLGTLLERLRSRLQQREAEVAVLKNEVKRIQQAKESLATELCNLSAVKTGLEEQLESMQGLSSALEDMEAEHATLLQMYGEKSEEMEELRMDLADVREAYKSQIDELVRQQTIMANVEPEIDT